MHEDSRYEAVSSRDARFDGAFFFAVSTTGIYCRPSCPATTPRRRNVAFFPTAAAAQGSGFRACRRCRPDAVPGSAEWNARADLVGRAMRLISDGVVDREGVSGLAARLGYSARQVQRQLNAELGAGPVALARAQRAHTARVLLQTTGLQAAEIAFAAGFASVRQFNDTVKEIYALTPSELRAARPGKSARFGPVAAACHARGAAAAARPPGAVRGGELFDHLQRPAPSPASRRWAANPAPAPTGAPCACRTAPASPRSDEADRRRLAGLPAAPGRTARPDHRHPAGAPPLRPGRRPRTRSPSGSAPTPSWPARRP